MRHKKRVVVFTSKANKEISRLRLQKIFSSLKGCPKRRKSSQGKIAINLRPLKSPWGGGNQFVDQLCKYLKKNGYHITHCLEPGVSSILLIDPRVGNNIQFGVNEVYKFKQIYPHTKCIHRINECDQRKGTNFIDKLLCKANEVADYTVFISQWLRDYFIERWFDAKKPHQVIHNSADSNVFFPKLKNIYVPGDKFRIVTHHWSDNWMKGFKTYQEVDKMIADGELKESELMIIGRWPKELKWKAARTYPPCRGKKLAHLLRQNHMYLTASLWEPGGMHHIEAAQCGLPVIYHENGGGIVEVASLYGIGFREDVKSALLEARERYSELRQKVLNSSFSREEMCRLYEKVLVM